MRGEMVPSAGAFKEGSSSCGNCDFTQLLHGPQVERLMKEVPFQGGIFWLTSLEWATTSPALLFSVGGILGVRDPLALAGRAGLQRLLLLRLRQQGLFVWLPTVLGRRCIWAEWRGLCLWELCFFSSGVLSESG